MNKCKFSNTNLSSLEIKSLCIFDSFNVAKANFNNL